jgi:plastocyanin
MCRNLFLIAAGVALACASARADNHTVLVTNNAFVPADLTILHRDMVTWSWQLGLHTVTSDDGLFDSGLQVPPQTFSRRFFAPGDYWYYCQVHGSPGGIGQSGVVRVILQRDPIDDIDPAPHDP